MSTKVELYDGAYGNFDADVYRQVSIETYGKDFGQTSWVTTEESEQIPRTLALTSGSQVLEIGCGSGAYALHVAKTYGCHLVGLDINELGVDNANQLASGAGLADRLCFEVCDASRPLPFAKESFDAVFSNDVLCHVQNRPSLLREIYRILKPGIGRMLFSDALVIGGLVSNHEIAGRSSIGFYLFSPPGENERLIQSAGFSGLQVLDTTDNVVLIASRWREAREKHRERLIAAEGLSKWEGLQRFLTSVQTLTQERRLLRHLYHALKI